MNADGTMGETKARLERILLPAAAFCWPFVYFVRLVVASGPTYRALGVDFPVLYYNYKVYLLDCLSHLRLPLWCPAEAAGFPFYCNPFTQAFYPLNLPLAFAYVCRGGYTPLDHQRFTVLGVAIFSLGIWWWLRSLGYAARPSLLGAIIMSVSFKIAEALRFPNAVHTAAWYPWMLFAVTRVVQTAASWDKVKAGLLLCLFTVCFLTAGYPYFVYYSIFLFGPYLCGLFIPGLSRRLTGAAPRRPALSLAVVVGSGLAAILACAPYLYKMNAMLRQTVDRAGGAWEYATWYRFTPIDSLGCLIYPPAAQTEGWYYFSVVGLLLAVLFLVDREGSWVPRILFLAWFAAISWITYGKDSALFAFLWQHLPLFSRLRVWARLNVVFVPALAWVIASGYTRLEELLACERGSARRRLALGSLGVACVALAVAQWILHRSGTQGSNHWYPFFEHLGPLTVGFLWYGLAASLLLLGLLRFGKTVAEHGPGWLWLVTGLVAATAAADMGNIGTQIWTGTGRTAVPRRLDVDRSNRDSFGHARKDDCSTLSPDGEFSVGIVENWYFARYAHFLQQQCPPTGSNRRALLGVTRVQKLFFSERIDHATVKRFLVDADRFGNASVAVLSYDGDALSVKVEARVDGFLSYVDNWDSDWQATVDGRPVPIERLFGTFKSVRLTAGAHYVNLVYRPFAWGRTWRPG